jgi:hypothetical protein
MRALLLIAMTACIETPSGTGIIGTRTDMTTQPGTYTGYRVVTKCTQSPTNVGVIGTGMVAVPNTAAIAAAGQDLHMQLSDLKSVWGWGGSALGCEPGVGTEIDLDDWRDVDTVIARTGAWLRDRGYALQVAIFVEGIPVADAQ